MGKQVRLVVGEGENKREIGIADVEKIPNGDMMVQMTITDPNVVRALGGHQIKGVIPNPVEEEDSNG